jgi:glucan biosynthesis protein
MPTPMDRLNEITSRPRRCLGASSAMYMGVTCDDPPTANPSRMRESASRCGLGEMLEQNDPAQKTQATVMMVRFLPMRSEIVPQLSAPITAPTRMDDATISCIRCPR